MCGGTQVAKPVNPDPEPEEDAELAKLEDLLPWNWN